MAPYSFVSEPRLSDMSKENNTSAVSRVIDSEADSASLEQHAGVVTGICQNQTLLEVTEKLKQAELTISRLQFEKTKTEQELCELRRVHPNCVFKKLDEDNGPAIVIDSVDNDVARLRSSEQ